MKNEPLKHLRFDLLRSPLETQPFNYEVARIAAQVADLSDRAITEAMIAAAQQEGLTDLYLIDRQFLFEAIKEKVEREKNEPLTLDELRQMDGEPVWIVEEPDWGHWELSADAEDYLVEREPAFYGMTHDDPAGRYGLHLLGWLAYRHKPKEATP